jgi:hypothetical protein
VGFAIWRETLIDATIFREAITINGARAGTACMANLLCELFYRAKATGLTEEDTLVSPVNLARLGEAFLDVDSDGQPHAALRKSRTVDFQRGVLRIKETTTGQFDPAYLHLKKAPI